MKRCIPLALMAFALATLLALPSDLALAQRATTPTGNPSALIAAESGFARLAREKGQWTAFANTAADDAEMFVPQRTVAKPWLKNRTNPAQPLQRQTQSVWTSCDGSAGVTFGASQSPDGGPGWFSTVWRQQKKGDFKWVLDQGGNLAKPLPAPDWIEGKVADCPARARTAEEAAPSRGDARKWPPPQRPIAGPIPPVSMPATDTKDGQSNDGSLVWRSILQDDGTRVWMVWMWKDGRMDEVLHMRASGS